MPMDAVETFFSVTSVAGAGAIFLGAMLQARGSRGPSARWTAFRVAFPMGAGGRSRPLTDAERRRVMQALEELSAGQGHRAAA